MESPPPVVPSANHDLEHTYRQRFSQHDVIASDTVWKEIAAYLQRFLLRDGPVLDVACGHGAFIRHIVASERWATDLRDVSGFLTPDIKFVQAEGSDMANSLPHDHFEMVFISNFLEHLPSAAAVVQQIRQADIVLKPGGTLVILQPNIRLTGGKYWDFLDHKTPLTEKSLDEAANLVGFTREHLITRFLPYSTKSKLPQSAPLVHWYLRFPPAWWLMGKQTLYVGTKPE
jgi:2-polyprenyl-3-methyl-5-hydroxy-6-metoxy-1,4-benzoquinol methylase